MRCREKNTGSVRLAVIGRIAPGSPAATVLLLGALFLAHGQQCAAAEGHDAPGMSHAVTADGTVHLSMQPVGAAAGLLTASTVSQAAHLLDSTGTPGSPGHLGVVCVAALLAGAACWLLLARRQPSRKAPPLAPIRWPGAFRVPIARWPWAPPNLTLLCVSRT